MRNEPVLRQPHSTCPRGRPDRDADIWIVTSLIPVFGYEANRRQFDGDAAFQPMADTLDELGIGVEKPIERCPPRIVGRLIFPLHESVYDSRSVRPVIGVSSEQND